MNRTRSAVGYSSRTPAAQQGQPHAPPPPVLLLRAMGRVKYFQTTTNTSLDSKHVQTLK